MIMPRQTIHTLIWCAVLLMAGAACQAQGGRSFINHTAPPQADLDFTAFEGAGCPDVPNRLRICQPDSPLRALGCHEIREPSALVGFLEPEHPVIYCVLHPSLDPGNPFAEIERLREEGRYIKEQGGLDPIFFRYAIARQGEYAVLETAEDFQAVFAPVESPEEALSFALALTNLQAYYGQSFDPELEYFVDRIEDTHVETVSGGYEVQLFHYAEFGCGPHPTSSVVVRVATDGTLDELSRQNVYKDPAEDNLCVD